LILAPVILIFALRRKIVRSGGSLVYMGNLNGQRNTKLGIEFGKFICTIISLDLL
jgi:hypothetical protein